MKCINVTLWPGQRACLVSVGAIAAYHEHDETNPRNGAKILLVGGNELHTVEDFQALDRLISRLRTERSSIQLDGLPYTAAP